MFDWATGSSVHKLMDEGVPGAGCDSWLERWMIARACYGWEFTAPFRVLDLRLGDGPRSHIDFFSAGGATVLSASATELPGDSGGFDLVCLLSFEREERLRPLDFGNPFGFLDLLVKAAALLNPGGTLFWSYLYPFPSDPDDVTDALEPAALFKHMLFRGYMPVSLAYPVVERLRMIHSGDTLFVTHKAMLAHGDSYRKLLRVFAAVCRPGAVEPSLRFTDGVKPAPPPEPPPPPAPPEPPPPPDPPVRILVEPTGRQLLRILARKVLRKAKRMLPGG